MHEVRGLFISKGGAVVAAGHEKFRYVCIRFAMQTQMVAKGGSTLIKCDLKHNQ